MLPSSTPRIATTISGWCAAIWVSTASSPARHRWCTWRCAELSATAEARELWVIVNHWKYKSQDTPTVKYTLPRHIKQAKFVSVEPMLINADYPKPTRMCLTPPAAARTTTQPRFVSDWVVSHDVVQRAGDRTDPGTMANHPSRFCSRNLKCASRAGSGARPWQRCVSAVKSAQNRLPPHPFCGILIVSRSEFEIAGHLTEGVHLCPCGS